MINDSFLYNTYSRDSLAFDHGRGARLFTSDGDEYLDFCAGVAVNSLGHCHPYLQKILVKQASKLWHLSNLFTVPEQERLAARLCENTFAQRVFFTNSGAEAIECAIKTARRYHYARGESDRFNILTFSGAFHGRTIATIAAGGQEKYIEGFGPKAPGFISVPLDDYDCLKAAINEQTAAIMIEPVQGEGGVRQVSEKFLSSLRQLCDEHGILLIFDEVQTGAGRTGRLFSYQWTNVKPDIMGIAKGIGGGFPVGACLATERAASCMVTGTHGSTYGGNAIAMAVANGVLDVILQDGFLQKVCQISCLLRKKLGELVTCYSDLIGDITGSGLLIGLKAKIANHEIIAAARSEKLLVIGAGNNVVRLAPPLIIDKSDVYQAIEKLDFALKKLSVHSIKK